MNVALNWFNQLFDNFRVLDNLNYFSFLSQYWIKYWVFSCGKNSTNLGYIIPHETTMLSASFKTDLKKIQSKARKQLLSFSGYLTGSVLGSKLANTNQQSTATTTPTLLTKIWPLWPPLTLAPSKQEELLNSKFLPLIIFIFSFSCSIVDTCSVPFNFWFLNYTFLFHV